MAELPDERDLVLSVRERLDDWTRRARRDAYEDLFQGADPILDEDALRVLDAIDSELERDGGEGVWGTDQYGVHTGGAGGSSSEVGVVCVYHPQITADSVLRGRDDVDDELERELNAALWRYSERVVELIETELEAFVEKRKN